MHGVGNGPPLLAYGEPIHEVRRDRLRWLAQLRWWAMTGTLLGAIVAVAADWSFVSAPAIAAGVAFGVFVNGALLWRTRRGNIIGPHELSIHVVADLLLLTWLLAWSGGIKNPLSVIFSFHVVLGALLAGRRGTLIATAGALACMVLLFGLEYAGALPLPPVERAPELLWVISLGLLVSGLSYFALVLAGRLRSERRNALRTQEEAVHNLRLLLDALDALKVGLELFDPSGEVRVRNPYARTLRALPVLGDRGGLPTAEPSQSGEGVGLFRFAALEPDGGRRIIDKLTLSPSPEVPLGAFLYVDRTEELLVEQRHVLLERLATLGRALQGVAHELNTPLMTMQTLAKDLQAALSDLPLDDAARDDLGESLDIIIEESRRCKGLTQSLLSTAHDGSQRGGAGGQTALQVARRAVQLVGPSAKPGEVELDELSLDRPLPTDGDRVMQVLMNLVQNALKATEATEAREGPRVRLSARAADGALCLDIDDNGPGLPAEVRARLFEPFVTTRPAGEGTGLGLYVSHMIAQELGGELLLEDREGGGTRARLILRAPAEEGRAIDEAKRAV